MRSGNAPLGVGYPVPYPRVTPFDGFSGGAQWSGRFTTGPQRVGRLHDHE